MHVVAAAPLGVRKEKRRSQQARLPQDRILWCANWSPGLRVRQAGGLVRSRATRRLSRLRTLTHTPTRGRSTRLVGDLFLRPARVPPQWPYGKAARRCSQVRPQTRRKDSRGLPTGPTVRANGRRLRLDRVCFGISQGGIQGSGEKVGGEADYEEGCQQLAESRSTRRVGSDGVTMALDLYSLCSR